MIVYYLDSRGLTSYNLLSKITLKVLNQSISILLTYDGVHVHNKKKHTTHTHTHTHNFKTKAFIPPLRT
jgi:hypothetical protein